MYLVNVAESENIKRDPWKFWAFCDMWSVKSETVGAFGTFDPSKLNLERLKG